MTTSSLVQSFRPWLFSTAGLGLAGWLVVLDGGLENEQLALLVLITITMAVTWNLVGLTGLYSFAQPAFYGIGAYVAAVLFTRYPGVPILVALLAGAGAATLAAIALAPCLRLRALYFAILTTAITLLLLLVFSSYGPAGSSGIYIPITASPSGAYSIALALVAVAVSTLVFRIIQRSDAGVALLLIGADEDAAAAIGIATFRMKFLAFVVGAPFVGFVGALFMANNAYIDPNTAFSAQNGLVAILATLLGGIGTYYGPIIGAIVWEVGSYELGRVISSPGPLLMINGAVLMLVILVLPRGLVSISGQIGRLSGRNVSALRVRVRGRIAQVGDSRRSSPSDVRSGRGSQ